MTVRFLDTNVLLYSLSSNPAEARKRAVAVSLLDAEDIAMSVQVLQEFYVQATRATGPDALPHDIAAGLVRTWLRFKIQETTLPVMLGALEITATHGLSYWDAAILAAARALGCRELLSEDMAHGREVEGILVTNPFRSFTAGGTPVTPPSGCPGQSCAVGRPRPPAALVKPQDPSIRRYRDCLEDEIARRTAIVRTLALKID